MQFSQYQTLQLRTAGHQYHLCRESDDKILYRCNRRELAEKKQLFFKCATYIRHNITLEQAIEEHRRKGFEYRVKNLILVYPASIQP